MRALDPDLVLANVEENTRQDVEALESAGLTVFLTYARTLAEAIAELSTIATITDAEAAARPIVEEAEHELLQAEAANASRKPVSAFCPIWRNPWMTIGPDTYIHDVLRVCGAANVYGASSERYPLVELADVANRRPNVVLLPDEPYRFAEKHKPEVIAALGDIRICLVDGKMLCWYGPRIANSLRRLQAILQGDTGV